METIPVYFSSQGIMASRDKLFFRRAAAYLLDYFPLLLFTQLVLFWAWGYSPIAPSGQEVEWRGECWSEARFARSAARYSAFLLWLCYSAIMESSPWNATLGKRWLGLTVLTSNGKALNFPQACCRNVLKIFSYLPFGLGFLYMAFDSKQQTWHGRMSATFVVDSKR